MAQSGAVTAGRCGGDLTYLLADNGLFLQTEYKVLQNQTEERFVRCMRMLYNGQIQLYYATDGYRPLASLAAELDHRRAFSVAESLLAGVLAVRNNGFLECRNLAAGPEDVFVDTAGWKAKLMYFPLTRHQYGSDEAFEQALRQTLLGLLSRPDLQSRQETGGLYQDLAAGRMGLEEIWQRHQRQAPRLEPRRPARRPDLRIVSMSFPTPFDLQVTADRFTVGRDRADGIISFADTISAPHCEICWNGEGYTVADLDSTNGTYLNRQPLRPEQAEPLNNGDVLRLADCDFRVVIG